MCFFQGSTWQPYQLILTSGKSKMVSWKVQGHLPMGCWPCRLGPWKRGQGRNMIYIYTYIHICFAYAFNLCIYIHTHTYIFNVFTHIYIYIHMYIYIYIYIYMFVYLYIHTHITIYSQFQTQDVLMMRALWLGTTLGHLGLFHIGSGLGSL